MKIDFNKIIAHLLYEDKSGAPYTKGFTKACMREACIQVLDEAAKRAKTKRVELHGGRVIDKQSILQIKEEL
ncbi:hypothetical protein [Gracilimonas sp.]|uniref:hypothetical protein n=1 Tax=Gracilimonas sp. TaxID=1974203 RepID=UPI002872882F|nr:hypothetical protein [Gracilimonas sp.]